MIVVQEKEQRKQYGFDSGIKFLFSHSKILT